MNIKEPMEQELNIELAEDMAEGTYANLALIAHSQGEFVLDFIRMMPNMPKAKVKARIIISPEHAKRLVGALIDNIQKYEEQFGDITPQQEQSFRLPMNFGGAVGEA